VNSMDGKVYKTDASESLGKGRLCVLPSYFSLLIA